MGSRLGCLLATNEETMTRADLTTSPTPKNPTAPAYESSNEVRREDQRVDRHRLASMGTMARMRRGWRGKMSKASTQLPIDRRHQRWMWAGLWLLVLASSYALLSFFGLN